MNTRMYKVEFDTKTGFLKKEYHSYRIDVKARNRNEAKKLAKAEWFCKNSDRMRNIHVRRVYDAPQQIL